MVLVSVTEKRYARSGCPYFLAALRYEPASLSSTKTDRRTLLPLLLNVSDLERWLLSPLLFYTSWLGKRKKER